MNRKLIGAIAMSAILAGSVSTTSVRASDAETAAAIAGIVALGVLGAAIAQDQHERGETEYKHHPRVHADENAVGACMHRAKHLVKKAGGHRAHLNKVNKIEAKPNGNTVVNFHVTGVYDFGSKKSRVHCVVKNHKVIKFDYS